MTASDEYITVKKFASMAGISHQAIYKAVKQGRLNQYIKYQDSICLISVRALQDVFNVSDESINTCRQSNELCNHAILDAQLETNLAEKAAPGTQPKPKLVAKNVQLATKTGKKVARDAQPETDQGENEELVAQPEHRDKSMEGNNDQNKNKSDQGKRSGDIENKIDISGKILDIFEKQLEEKDRLLKAKDEEIQELRARSERERKDLQDKLASAYAQISNMAQKAQYITAADKTVRLIDQQARPEESENLGEFDEMQRADIRNQEKKKEGFWFKLFRR